MAPSRGSRGRGAGPVKGPLNGVGPPAPLQPLWNHIARGDAPNPYVRREIFPPGISFPGASLCHVSSRIAVSPTCVTGIFLSEYQSPYLLSNERQKHAMDMSIYWDQVVGKIKFSELPAEARSPDALEQVTDSGRLPASTEFAHDVIPNIGPGGPTSEEDEEDLAERDPDQEIQDADGPSLSGDRAYMMYFAGDDELFVWDGEWRMWNY